MHPVTNTTIGMLLSLVVCYIIEFSIQTFLLSFIVLLTTIAYFDQDQKYKLPPGPLGLPIIGCLPWLWSDSNNYMIHCHKKYGALFTLRLGNEVNVIINDYEMIKEFSNLPQAQYRPENGIFRMLLKGKGIVDSEGDIWKHQRRFVVQCLRDCGMGKLQMDDKITGEIDKMIKYIENKGGKPMSFRGILSNVASSVICNLAFDKQFDYEDPEFIELLKLINDEILLMGKLSPCTFFPWLKPFFKEQFQLAQTNIDTVKTQCIKIIDEHKRCLDPDNPRDLIDLYLLEMNKERSGGKKDYLDTFSEEELIYTTINLFFAGTETSSSTILWALAYMAMYSEIQKKVQDEIDDVLGAEGIPSTNDKHKLPYTMATLQEVERMAAIVPRAVPRSNKVPLSFHGYLFPPNTTFNFNIYAVHNDPRLWKDPDVFNPDRFIQSDGTVFRPPYLIPFGSGRRLCTAEALARTEIFLLFSSLMHKFSFKIPDGIPLKLKSEIGIVNNINDYKLEAVSR